MRKLSVTMIGLAMMALAACDRGSNAGSLATDTALARDLNLASQAQPFRLDSVSPLETAQMAPAEDAEPIAATPTPVRRTRTSSASSTRRARSYPTSTRRRSTSSGRTSTASSGDVAVTAPSEGRVIVKKNTKRDAAIGAAAGAVLGAATSRNKVKGAVIGGVAGGVIGAIIGNNVDVKKTRVP
jgi:hypothetical protein